MNQRIIISDFDGVIGDSLRLALIITKRIVDIFDNSEKINSFNDFYRLLGKQSELNNITEKESNTLRELYRIIYRHSSNKIGLFTEVIEIYSNLNRKPVIVSSSYSDVIKRVLGNYQKLFDGIYGYDNGHKIEILQKLKDKHRYTYITDTARDIIICRNIGVPVIATCWGYDSIEKIKVEKPDFLIRNFKELNEFMITHNYFNKDK